jgi:hypothetical protein
MEENKEEKTNRDIFVETYEVIVKQAYPYLDAGILNDCRHGCLIAINSKFGLSSETLRTAEILGINPTKQDIINYVYNRETTEEQK